ncbi:hypothetical protein PoB_004661500 [Plakobranchus ocellatus]|uniref:Uncharacterized protein n=1 Tax=Plakobranchus ocellatus TaxID=259542 RepID=A0AAV4BHT5_9GAST|nr:hypothetical protein PoB_004661500 [Plakobranchus ocellatus]
MLNCYLPSVCKRIPCLLSNDLTLLDGAANVQGPVKAVDNTIPQEIEENTDIIDLDKIECNDTSCGQLQWESADNSFEDEKGNSTVEGVPFSCRPIVEYQEATRPNSKT